MPHCNVLIGCDQTYYDQWAVPLLKSVYRHNPWVRLHCHIVNPTKENKLDHVDITEETIEFSSETVRISYLQSVRFLAVANKFSNNEKVITLDADSICTRAILDKEIEQLFEHQYVLKHHKEDRWLAGFVTFSDNGFRQEYATELKSDSIETWNWGRDQTVLNNLAKKYDFKSLNQSWMSIGKHRYDSVFLTLKGEQKETEKYLNVYKNYLE